ncbi:glycosyltransferase family 4 protein [Flavobacterium johnsoniae]|uniref:Glycosyl transferase family 1 domain-containing protein n=1 Tax=Flavobacterium johnsoniae TaxID=986 RepID=A0A1J7BX23_FLAJO|nr:glycosyltransferase family 4 protein [Flavobacterium johnsoniae]OIV43203.1 hypothetical protein BKM63_03045 [Flavobacterium johnsoniae]
MNSSKKLIIFSFDFPPSNGGIARLCQEIAVGMKPYYKSIQVLTPKKEGVNLPYNLKEVEVIKLPKRRILCELKAIQYLSKIKNKDNYDIICGTWHPEAILCKVSGFKNIFVLAHGAELTSGNSSFRRNVWLPFYAKFILNNVKLTVANSNFTKKLVNKISDSANCQELPLGVNNDFFKPSNVEISNEVLKICTVSRIEEFKGHDFVAKTLLKLNENYNGKIIWNIAGTGGYLSKLIQRINNLGISNLVTFHGFIKDEDLPNFYNSNDLFVLCTRENHKDINVEGFGLVFLEAQSCGIPVIGTTTGGISDAVEQNNGGWLIEQDNESDLYDLISSLLNDRSILKNEGLRARKRVDEKCTWEIYCENLFQIMQ